MFKNELFKNYVESNASISVRNSSWDVEINGLVIGKLGITANVVGVNHYKVNIVLHDGKIHSAYCSCPRYVTQICEHIVAVLKEADDLLHSNPEKFNGQTVLLEDGTSAHRTIFAFHNFSFEQLTNTFIFKHLSSIASTSFRAHYIQKIEYGYAEIVISKTYFDRETVSITYHNEDLTLICNCLKPKNVLCEHQEQAMFLLKDDAAIRVFFDADYRLKYLQKKSVEFGLENETNLDDFFTLKLDQNSIVVKPILKGLISLGDSSKLRLEKELCVVSTVPEELKVQTSSASLTFVVIGEEQYGDEFFINLMASNSTKEGKIKNPIRPIDAKNFLFQSEDAEEMKFYMGLNQFQSLDYRHSVKQKEEQELTSLRAIVKNPLSYDVYYLNSKLSDNITSSSIVPVTLRKVEIDLHLKVVQKDHFYEITPKAFIDGSLVSYTKLKLLFKYFLKLDNELLFVPDLDVIRVINYFKKHNNKLLIHQTKFEEFRAIVLANLESKISIEYTFLKPANAQQLIEQGFDVDLKQILYLSESEDFVLLTPVIKYGSVEIPVRSKKRIYALDVLGEPFEVERDESAEINLLLMIQRQHTTFEEQEGFDYFYLHKKHFLNEGWFLNVFEEWKEAKIEVLGFNDLKDNNLSSSKMSVSIQVSSGIDWFDTAVKVSFGNQEVRLRDIQRSIHNESRFVKLGDGKLGMMPQEWIDKFSKFFRTGEVHDNQIRTAKAHFSVIDDLFESEVLTQDVANEIAFYRKRMDAFNRIEEVEIPKKLKAELRDYQKHGLNWLHFLDEFNFGGCLADDMGLGKTIQIIAFILSLKEKNGLKTHLIVLPTSLLFNWRAELKKFAPSLKYHTIYGVDRQKDHEGLNKFDIVFTTYGTLLCDISFLKNFHFDYVFLDESQAVKNPESKRYKSVRLLQARNRVVLTGTPIENNTFDLYAQFSFVSPGLLGNQQRFRDNYSIPIDKFKDLSRAQELQQKLNPFLLRRTKKQVATELPEKTEMVIFCEMGKEQRKVYDSYKNEFKLYLQGNDKEDLLNKNMHILAGLTKLRQICNSPALLSDQEYYGNESAKMDELLEQIEMKSGQHKILVFSQFVTMLDMIKKQLDEREIKYEYLTGKTKDRAGRVQNFQEDTETRVFLISMKAGGTGLNLTEADYVFIVDPWWNPAVENQAIDRCYRIGQKKNVMAIRLICPDTIEEKIMLLQESKKELIDDLIKVDGQAAKSLSKEDLLSLLD